MLLLLRFLSDVDLLWQSTLQIERSDVLGLEW